MHGAAGRYQLAAQLLGAATALRQIVRVPQPPIERPDTERVVSVACGAVGEEVWAAAFEQGKAMPLEEAIALALEKAEMNGGEESSSHGEA